MRFRLSGHVINETIEGEAIVIDLNSGTYYSLDDAGAVVWDAIGRGEPVEHIVASLTEQYLGEPDTIEAEVRRLIDALVTEGLISEDHDGPTSVAPIPPRPAGTRPHFRAPTLQKYTDMQDLILLDPVHEVEQEKGWPHHPDRPAAHGG